MEHYYININKVNLMYPSTRYNALTLKQEVFKLLRVGKKTKLLLDVHALKNINIEINEGERVGVIGRNGAGKSTLLRVIAGLLPIMSGSIDTAGNIRSMFELSLGFEFEATGRENIMYRGLLLGEKPKNIIEREGEIIKFADLGDFIDYPIKSYSSGMLVRLAFSISTLIQGDILLLDEILGAGDLSFQAKAQKKMESLIEQAKIIVLVSHDLTAIRRICERVIYMKDGEIIDDGPAEPVIDKYFKANA